MLKNEIIITKIVLVAVLCAFAFAKEQNNTLRVSTKKVF